MPSCVSQRANASGAVAGISKLFDNAQVGPGGEPLSKAEFKKVAKAVLEFKEFYKNYYDANHHPAAGCGAIMKRAAPDLLDADLINAADELGNFGDALDLAIQANGDYQEYRVLVSQPRSKAK